MTGQLVDFPNPLGYVLNPLLIFVAGCLLWFLWWLAYTLIRSLVSKMDNGK